MRALATSVVATIVVALAAGAMPAEPVGPEASAPVPPDATAFVLAVVGDGPYSEPDCDEHACLARQLEALDPRADLLVHVGDIRQGDTEVPCTAAEFRAVAALLERAPVPTIIVPGDNEWNDCPDPAAAAERWRAVFLAGDGTEFPWPVAVQTGRPENRSFDVDGVRVVAVNVVGGRVHDRGEWDGRLADDVAWLETRLAKAPPEIRAAVVIGHATPRVFGFPRGALLPFFDGLERTASRFARPLLYVHGDGHAFQRAHDVGPDSAMRLQVARIGIARPTVVTIAPGRDEPFVIEKGAGERCCR